MLVNAWTFGLSVAYDINFILENIYVAFFSCLLSVFYPDFALLETIFLIFGLILLQRRSSFR